MRRFALSFVAVLAAVGGAAAAEEPPAPLGPPPVLIINKEEIKPGLMGPHEKNAARFVAIQNKANADAHRLGLTPVSGDDNVVMYLEGYASFEDMEKSQRKFEATIAADAALRGELDQNTEQGAGMHASQKTALAVFRSDLSFRPVRMDEVAKARYFSVNTTRLNLGQMPAYEAYTKALNAARDKINADWVHTAVYQILSGAPANTFVTFTLFRSLTEWDEITAKMVERNKAIDEALGGEEVVKERRKQAREIMAESSSALFAVSPTISRPSPQFLAYDPGFWTPKAAAGGKALTSKKETKPAPKP
jgi:hypothetical protein